jgi:hypothetical protein
MRERVDARRSVSTHADKKNARIACGKRVFPLVALGHGVGAIRMPDHESEMPMSKTNAKAKRRGGI